MRNETHSPPEPRGNHHDQADQQRHPRGDRDRAPASRTWWSGTAKTISVAHGMHRERQSMLFAWIDGYKVTMLLDAAAIAYLDAAEATEPASVGRAPSATTTRITRADTATVPHWSTRVPTEERCADDRLRPREIPSATFRPLMPRAMMFLLHHTDKAVTKCVSSWERRSPRSPRSRTHRRCLIVPRRCRVITAEATTQERTRYRQCEDWNKRRWLGSGRSAYEGDDGADDRLHRPRLPPAPQGSGALPCPLRPAPARYSDRGHAPIGTPRRLRTVPGCERKHVARGMCMACYQQNWRRKRPLVETL